MSAKYKLSLLWLFSNYQHKHSPIDITINSSAPGLQADILYFLWTFLISLSGTHWHGQTAWNWLNPVQKCDKYKQNKQCLWKDSIRQKDLQQILLKENTNVMLWTAIIKRVKVQSVKLISHKCCHYLFNLNNRWQFSGQVDLCQCIILWGWDNICHRNLVIFRLTWVFPTVGDQHGP